MPDEPDLVHRLSALGDPVRLRILRLLDTHELSVGELARALQLPQSTVSRHLKLLHEGRWIVKRAEGTASLYQLVEGDLSEDAMELWQLARAQLRRNPTIDDDDRRVAEVLAERTTDSRAYFGRLGGEWDDVREHLFGTAFTSDALIALFAGGLDVADLGCGTGQAAALMAPVARHLIAIDREPGMLGAAQRRLEGVDADVEFREGDLLDLPLDDASIDAATILLVLHHVNDPDRAVAEASRALRPDGRLLIVDMLTHDRENYRHTMGHIHLGFDRATVDAWATAAGMQLVKFHPLRPDTTAKGPGLFAAVLSKL